MSEGKPCGTCGTTTPYMGTGLCDGCWEVERRLRDYIRTGGAAARRFISTTLAEVDADSSRTPTPATRKPQGEG